MMKNADDTTVHKKSPCQPAGREMIACSALFLQEGADAEGEEGG